MTTKSSDWLWHFRLLLWNHRSEFHESWQEASSPRSLQVLCFRTDPSKDDSSVLLLTPRHFQIFLYNRWKQLDETWQETSNQRPLRSLCFSGRSVIKIATPTSLASDWLKTHLRIHICNLNESWRKQIVNGPYHVCAFQVDPWIKIAALVSDFLTYFRLFL